MNKRIEEIIDQKTITFKEYSVKPEQTGVFFIGDVHGCLDELKELVEKIESFCEEKGVDPLIFCLGDLIDRGPHLKDIFDYVAKTKHIYSLAGNHEWNFFLEAQEIKECRSRARRDNLEKFWKYDEKQQQKILDTIGKMPTMINVYVADGDRTKACVVTHAPIKDIETKTVIPVTSNNMMFRSEAVDNDKLFERFGNMPLLYIHGHQSWNFDKEHLQEVANSDILKFCTTLNLDSGCVYGKELSAYSPTHNTVIQVNANKTYFKYN